MIEYIDSIEKIWQKSLVRINFDWPWATVPQLKSITDIITAITVHLIGLVATLRIISFSTFRIVVTLYTLTVANQMSVKKRTTNLSSRIYVVL